MSDAADVGPNEGPPGLPRGWIAQWDASARKYYYVQLSTSHAQWEIPTEPAPGVDTPSSTPMPGSTSSQFSRPPGSPETPATHADSESTRGGLDGQGGSERGLGSMAMNAVLGKQGHNQGGGGALGNLASQFLSGGSSHSGSGSSHGASGGGAGAIASQLIGSVLGGSKPHHGSNGSNSGNNSSSASHNQHSGYGTSGPSHSSSHSSGGMLGGLLGGHGQHGSHNQNYGYSSSPSPAGGYSGTAPPAQYQPGQHHSSSSYGPSSGSYNTGGYGQSSGHPPPQHHVQSPSGGHSYVHRPDDPTKPFYVGGTPFDEPAHGSPYGSAPPGNGSHQGYGQGSQGQNNGHHTNFGQHQNNQWNSSPGPQHHGGYQDGRYQGGYGGQPPPPGGYGSGPPPSHGGYGHDNYGGQQYYGGNQNHHQNQYPGPPPGGPYGGGSEYGGPHGRR